MFRECILILLGIGVAFVASLFSNAGRGSDVPVAAFLIPIAFFLIHVPLVQYPSHTLPALWRSGFQLAQGLGFLSLFVN